MVALFVILTVVGFIVVDSIVQWTEARREREASRQVPRPVGYHVPAFAFEGASVPQGIFLDSGHTWVRVNTSGASHVGMDDFSQKAIGRVDEVELPQVGQEVHRGEKLFAIRQGSRKAVFAAPIDGVISSVNETLARHPDAIKTDPYAQGWICALKPKNLARSIKRLFIAEEAVAWLNEEIQRFQEFIRVRPVQQMALDRVLQDGGQLTEGVLELMDEETWSLFTDEFLCHPTA